MLTPALALPKRSSALLGVGAATLVCALLACWSPFESEAPTWLQASVFEADSAKVFEGTGVFHVGHPPPGHPLGVDVLFEVSSAGTGDSEGETLVLSRFGDGQPRRGEYELGPWRRVAFTGQYRRSLDDGTRESYVVESGRIVITRSSDERVEGAFRFTALLYCVDEPDEAWPGYECHPAEPLANGPPPLEVEGSFSAGTRQPGWVVDDAMRP